MHVSSRFVHGWPLHPAALHVSGDFVHGRAPEGATLHISSHFVHGWPLRPAALHISGGFVHGRAPEGTTLHISSHFVHGWPLSPAALHVSGGFVHGRAPEGTTLHISSHFVHGWPLSPPALHVSGVLCTGGMRKGKAAVREMRISKKMLTFGHGSAQPGEIQAIPPSRRDPGQRLAQGQEEPEQKRPERPQPFRFGRRTEFPHAYHTPCLDPFRPCGQQT